MSLYAQQRTKKAEPTRPGRMNRVSIPFGNSPSFVQLLGLDLICYSSSLCSVMNQMTWSR